MPLHDASKYSRAIVIAKYGNQSTNIKIERTSYINSLAKAYMDSGEKCNLFVVNCAKTDKEKKIIRDNLADKISVDARTHAESMSDFEYGKLHKINFNKNHFFESLIVTYMLSESNQLKDILQKLKKIEDPEAVVLSGEIHILLLNAWNELCGTKLGGKSFSKMSIEDIIYDVPVTKFIRNANVIQIEENKEV